MKLFLIRHGESSHNALNFHQQKDGKLSQAGTKQAKFLAKRFSSLPIDLILSSPFERAAQTAQIIARVLRKEIIYTEFLEEMRHPSQIEGMALDDARALTIRNLRRGHINDQSWRYSDEENVLDFQQRGIKALEYLSHRKEENILAVSHSMMIIMLVSLILFKEKFTPEIFVAFLDHFDIKNTSITLCEYNKNSGWKLITLNDHAHLG